MLPSLSKDSPMLVLILDKFLIFVSVAFDLLSRELLFVGYTLFVLLSKMSLFMITKSIPILCKILIDKIDNFGRNSAVSRKIFCYQAM